MQLSLKNIIKKLLVSDSTRKFIRRMLNPASLYFLRHTTFPLSNYHGFDRGEPIDRFYIKNFLGRNQQHIRGVCLELLNDDYTVAYGKGSVIKSDVLDIDVENKNATIIDDLRNLKKVADNSYDCIILTQVFQFIDDVPAGISECHRILKKGGVLLVTLPSISRVDCISGVEGDFWRFTVASAKYLFQKKFNAEKLTVEALGNVRSGIYFYAGLSQEDTSIKILREKDSNFPLIITVKAIK